MTTMTEVTPHDNGISVGVSAIPQAATSYNLKRIGARPLRFNGSELAMAMSYTPSVPYWYEINIYRTTEQNFVSTIRLFYQSDENNDTVRAWNADSLDEAIEILTNFDAADDVYLPKYARAKTLSAAELSANAMQLLADIKGARDHYQSLIGEFLYDLECGA